MRKCSVGSVSVCLTAQSLWGVLCLNGDNIRRRRSFPTSIDRTREVSPAGTSGNAGGPENQVRCKRNKGNDDEAKVLKKEYAEKRAGAAAETQNKIYIPPLYFGRNIRLCYG
jgi:hypothetical protein